MNILFVTPLYYNLHKPIENELRRQGHCVDILYDNTIEHDNGYKHKLKIKKIIDYIIYDQEEIKKKYWEKIIAERDFSSYDICLCIGGFSLCNYFFEKIKEHNNRIKTILYLWDSLNYFDFRSIFKFFDRIYTFDYNDSQNSLAEFLPFYWTPNLTNVSTKYSVSLVGSCHDGRLWIADKVAKQLDDMGFSYFFKIVCDGKAKMTPSMYKQLIKSYLKGDEASILDIKALTGKVTHPFLTSVSTPIDETNNIIARSECILDTDIDYQAGPTPRLIWALALGKKVVTTNKNIVKIPFYNNKNIFIIDRRNPIINPNFITSKADDMSSVMEKYRIDNWVKILLEQ